MTDKDSPSVMQWRMDNLERSVDSMRLTLDEIRTRLISIEASGCGNSGRQSAFRDPMWWLIAGAAAGPEVLRYFTG